MDWVLYKRRGPEWKRGWAGQTMASISMPPLPLLAIFAIVIFLLSLSQYSGYKAQLQYSIVNFQLLLFLIPILLVFLMASVSVQGGRYVFRIPGLDHDSLGRVGSSPWGVAILVAVLLVLVSYQSLFHSQWFSPLRG
ncbi:hypothetical protein RJ641_013929 [Dillenia turbinata]|uniref:Uncharacterized protein n=1 Tax=Dillenia turbinata TaxID=194707 RepID=A0AAN8W5D6_9MAGN